MIFFSSDQGGPKTTLALTWSRQCIQHWRFTVEALSFVQHESKARARFTGNPVVL